MSGSPESFALDANVFIQAHRRFYPFDICPGYWDALCWYQRAGQVGSVEKVREELERGGDALWVWARDTFGPEGFLDTASVAGKFGEIAAWVNSQSQFTAAAKAEFMDVADGWLAAHAKVMGKVLVTLEEHKPDAKNKVPLVNVCRAFDIPTVTPFEMLRRLDIKLSWSPPNPDFTIV